MPERITDTIKRKTHTLIRSLGEGGQGTCFSTFCKTRKNKKKELVALKVILCDSPDKRVMASKEVEIQQSVEHKNVARLHRKFRVQNLNILVLELCSTDLGKMLRTRQRSSTLEIVHRDIKPSNIFIGSEGEAKVGDFGMAFVDDEGDANRPSCGTEGYKVKELQVGGVYHDKGDIFAFGATMCMMLTGYTHPDASSTIIGVDELSNEALKVVMATLGEEPAPQVEHKKKVRLSSPSSCPSPPAASSSPSSSGYKHKVPHDAPPATSAVESGTTAAAPPAAPPAAPDTNDQGSLSPTDVAAANNVATASSLSAESLGLVAAGAIGSAVGAATDAAVDAAVNAANEDIQEP
ncbi:hypothetical protein BGX24_010379 [Mortierella sp. AD032]|nr:hypothetical protein BGX24_010379 [Mortierella sp. AD032]